MKSILFLVLVLTACGREETKTLRAVAYVKTYKFLVEKKPNEMGTSHSVMFAASGYLKLPQFAITRSNSPVGELVLYIGPTVCHYVKSSNTSDYELKSCNDGSIANQIIKFPKDTTIQLNVITIQFSPGDYYYETPFKASIDVKILEDV